MANFGTTELQPLQGDLPSIDLPLAATQTIEVGEPVYLAATGITKWVAVSGTGNTDQQFIGWMGQPSYAMVAGVKTPLPVKTLVKVIPNTRNVTWTLPIYGATLALTDICSSTNETGFSIYNDAGTYKLQATDATKAVVRPFQPELMDNRSGAANLPQLVATYAVGSRIRCHVLNAAKQVTF